MRVAIAGSLLFLLTVAGVPAQAASGGSAVRDHRVHQCLCLGLKLLAAARKETTVSRKLVLLDRALDTLHRARGLRRLQGEDEKHAALDLSLERALIKTLNAKTRVFLERGSLPRARRANRAALGYSIADTEALNLRNEIDEAAALDLFEKFEGEVGTERLRGNRDAAGAPVRDRGAARRH